MFSYYYLQNYHDFVCCNTHVYMKNQNNDDDIIYESKLREKHQQIRFISLAFEPKVHREMRLRCRSFTTGHAQAGLFFYCHCCLFMYRVYFLFFLDLFTIQHKRTKSTNTSWNSIYSEKKTGLVRIRNGSRYELKRPYNNNKDNKKIEKK